MTIGLRPPGSKPADQGLRNLGGSGVCGRLEMLAGMSTVPIPVVTVIVGAVATQNTAEEFVAWKESA